MLEGAGTRSVHAVHMTAECEVSQRAADATPLSKS